MSLKRRVQRLEVKEMAPRAKNGEVILVPWDATTVRLISGQIVTVEEARALGYEMLVPWDDSEG